MRLAIAAAILFQGTAVTPHSSEPIIEDVQDDFGSTIEGQDVFKTIQEPSHVSRKNRHNDYLKLLKERKSNGEGFFAKALRLADEVQECIPGAVDADIGVLSCGVGRYCAESEESGAGGFCVPSPDEVDRLLQDDGNLFDLVYASFCKPASSEFGDRCACDSDSDNYLLYVSCSSDEDCKEYTSNCGVNITNCIEYNFEFNVTGPGNYTTSRCFIDSAPYDQTTCYESSAVYGMRDMCTIEVDGVTCNSCQIVEPEDVNITSGCYDFDCTNTIASKTGSLFCDKAAYVGPILNYLQTYGCIDYICPICGGENFVSTNPGGIISLGTGETTCAAVAQVALVGGFNRTFCREVVIPGVAEDCGCVPSSTPDMPSAPSGEGSTPPTSSPVEAPATTTPGGTEAPVAAPTTSDASIAFVSKIAVSLVGLSALAFMQFD